MQEPESNIEQDSSARLVSEFWSQVQDTSSIRNIVNQLLKVHVFIKNAQGRFIFVNQALAAACGYSDETEIPGKTDYDIFPTHLVENYLRDDRRLMETGEPIVNRLELVPNHRGKIDWFVTNKMPIFGKKREVIGLIGICQQVDNAQLNQLPFLDIAPVLEHIRIHFASPISVKDLAKIANKSVRQFERSFKKTVHMSPTAYILRTRIENACDLLLNTAKTISEIAHEVGFYDHSDLIRHFNKQMGFTPGAYREKHHIGK